MNPLHKNSSLIYQARVPILLGSLLLAYFFPSWIQGLYQAAAIASLVLLYLIFTPAFRQRLSASRYPSPRSWWLPLVALEVSLLIAYWGIYQLLPLLFTTTSDHVAAANFPAFLHVLSLTALPALSVLLLFSSYLALRVLHEGKTGKFTDACLQPFSLKPTHRKNANTILSGLIQQNPLLTITLNLTILVASWLWYFTHTNNNQWLWQTAQTRSLVILFSIIALLIFGKRIIKQRLAMFNTGPLANGIVLLGVVTLVGILLLSTSLTHLMSSTTYPLATLGHNAWLSWPNMWLLFSGLWWFHWAVTLSGLCARQAAGRRLWQLILVMLAPVAIIAAVFISLPTHWLTSTLFSLSKPSILIITTLALSCGFYLLFNSATQELSLFCHLPKLPRHKKRQLADYRFQIITFFLIFVGLTLYGKLQYLIYYDLTLALLSLPIFGLAISWDLLRKKRN